jgi:2-dehydro-3-deoxyphosphooctonate aldolase (KDO 8-P synthase)
MTSIKPVTIGNFSIGAPSDPLALMAGPCVAESLELCRRVADGVSRTCADLGISYIFKASFDKANRTSSGSFRGHGLEEGLSILSRIKDEFGVPIVTDVHESYQCAIVAEVADVLQIPAFLSRQTDLLLAAAATGKVVNVKKGQFLAPWDCKNIVDKMTGVGCDNLLLCERGTSFGYNNLVVDMTGLSIMRGFGHPVVYDGTHAVQQPGGMGSASGGRREHIPALVRAAVATGSVDALFLETHPEPEKALSDAATMLPLSAMRRLLTQAVQLFGLRKDYS